MLSIKSSAVEQDSTVPLKPQRATKSLLCPNENNQYDPTHSPRSNHLSLRVNIIGSRMPDKKESICLKALNVVSKQRKRQPGRQGGLKTQRRKMPSTTQASLRGSLNRRNKTRKDEDWCFLLAIVIRLMVRAARRSCVSRRLVTDSLLANRVR